MNIASTFISLSEPLELVKPRYGSFNNPASLAQATAMLGITLGQEGHYAQFPQHFSQRLAVIAAVSLKNNGVFPGSADLASNRGNGVYQRQCLGDIMSVGAGEFIGQGDAVAVGDQMVLTTRFAPICGVWAGLLPPKTALTEPESTTALEKSRRSARRNLARRTWCILSQTPAFCQSRNRRQQVMPLPQPISLGKYSQPMPVLRTKSIPVKAARSEMGLRPGYRNRRSRFGISGSISDHNCSSNIGLAMSNLLKIRLLMTSAVYLKNLSFC
jgi:hypothetical protein